MSNRVIVDKKEDVNRMSFMQIADSIDKNLNLIYILSLCIVILLFKPLKFLSGN